MQGSTTDRSLRLARIALTGRLASVTRAEFEAMVAAAGGEVCPGVTRRTSMLVVGMNGWPVRSDGKLSRMLERAETLREQGCPIEVLSERAFLERIGHRTAAPRAAGDAPKPMTAAQVCEAIGVESATLRRWEFAGLLHAHDGRYDFQDIVSLRTICDLLRRGASPRRIAEGVRGLSRILPDTDRPLSQLKIVIEDSGGLVAELGDAFLCADGQYLINFSPARRIDGVVEDDVEHQPLRLQMHAPLQMPSPQESAEDIFERARALEEIDRFDDAEFLYREALARRSGFPEAQFNLGNVLRNLGDLGAAAVRYRKAIEHAPHLVAAWFNLADVYDELGRHNDAVECLRRALELEPGYADAHYNLAYCLEGAGRFDEARDAWRAYLRLDPHSEWAAIAREHLGLG